MNPLHIESLEGRILRSATALPHRTSWLGNTFSGDRPASSADGVPQHVPDFANDLYTSPDGTVFTNTGYDEGDGADAIYKLDPATHQLDEIGAHGGTSGYSVSANSTRYYVSWTDGALATRPYGGANAITVWRAGGQGLDVRGIAASETELYVADAASQTIFVYDADLTSVLRSFPVSHPTKLALDPAGNVWVIEDAHGPGSPRIACYSPTGTFITAITDVTLPNALAIDRGTGQLMVADDGPSQQIRYYDISGPQPAFVRTFGDYGGIYGGSAPGSVGPHRFNFVEGIGTDAAGNLYVANNGWGRGLAIEAYAPDGSLISRVVGLSNIIDNAAYDPSTDSIFGNDERYAVDWNAAPGHEATYVATLGNKLLYPDDPRYHDTDMVNVVQGIRVVQGHRLLVEENMSGSALSIYRPGVGETWVPSAAIDTDARFSDSDVYPLGHPMKGTKFNTAWLWHDANGNGAFDAGEYEEDPLAASGAFVGGNTWMDDAGNLWNVNGGWDHALREFPLQGFDAAGNPMYSYSTVIESLPPAPLIGNSLSRIQYDSTTDTLYLMGSTSTIDNAVVRYDHWSDPLRRTIHQGFPLSLPRDINGLADNFPMAWSVAGSFLFVGYSRQSAVEVYDATSGTLVGELSPSTAVGDRSWVDAAGGINAFRRPNGEYEIFKEEDFGNKVVWYRWTPTGPSVTATATGVTRRDQTPATIQVTYSDPVGVDATTIGSANLVVQGPHGRLLSATLSHTDLSPDGTSCIATYVVAPPNGTWGTSDVGSYQVLTAANQVQNIDAQPVKAAAIATFAVSLPAVPTAKLAAPNVTRLATGAVYTFQVTFTDPTGVNVRSIGGQNLMVTGPNGFAQLAKLVAVTTRLKGTVCTATYSVVLSTKKWTASKNGTYAVSLRPNQVANLHGLYADAGGIGTFRVAVVTAVGALPRSLKVFTSALPQEWWASRQAP